MSQLQLGLQTAHCVAEMSMQKHEMFEIWAKMHKTIVILNGGNCESLKNLRDYLNHPMNLFPHASFEEDEASLNGAITSVGIILPEGIYEAARLVRNRTIFRLAGDTEYSFREGSTEEETANNEMFCNFYNNLPLWHVGLIQRLNTCGLA